jgi:hypothetical protein
MIVVLVSIVVFSLLQFPPSTGNVNTASECKHLYEQVRPDWTSCPSQIFNQFADVSSYFCLPSFSESALQSTSITRPRNPALRQRQYREYQGLEGTERKGSHCSRVFIVSIPAVLFRFSFAGLNVTILCAGHGFEWRLTFTAGQGALAFSSCFWMSHRA